MPQVAAATRKPAAIPDAPPPLRRRRNPEAPASSSLRSRVLHYILALVTVVLVVDSLVGDKGLLETMRARRQYEEVAASLLTLRQENTRLRDEIRRLKSDPATIESIARGELGLMRPGEVIFVIKDAPKP
jgi:cell division protein FtsB